MRRPTRREAVLAVAPASLIALPLLLWHPGHDRVGRSTDGTAAEGGGTGAVHAPSSFTISGDVGGAIAPGAMVPLDLSLENPNDFELAVDQITVTVQDVDAPRADADHPCSAADFEVRQFSGGIVLRLGRNRAQHLSDLGLAPDHWPAVGMRNRPVNQDGCKGASLTLGYEARGAGVPR